jgi:hypothetical protein
LSVLVFELTILSISQNELFFSVTNFGKKLLPTARAWRFVAAFGKRPARTGAWLKLQKLKLCSNAWAYPSPETDAAG